MIFEGELSVSMLGETINHLIVVNMVVIVKDVNSKRKSIVTMLMRLIVNLLQEVQFARLNLALMRKLTKSSSKGR